MRSMNRLSLIIIMLSAVTACNPGWKLAGGAVALSPLYLPHSLEPVLSATVEVKAPLQVSQASRRVSFALPHGWHWVMRGDDFISTNDGVFLQNIIIERMNIYQKEQSDGLFPLAALSSKQWPFRTIKNLKKPFLPGMSPAEAAEVVLASRANNAEVLNLEVREVVQQELAGNPGFKAVYDFSLRVQGRKVRYRAVYCGFMLDDWVYGINYTAAQRYYFEKDAGTFESFLQSVRLVEK